MHKGALVKGVLHVQVVVHNGHQAGYRGVSGSFSKSVDRGVDTLEAGLYGGVGVGHGKVIVIMGVEVKVQVRPFFQHPAAELVCLVRIQDSKGIRKHKALHTLVLEPVYQERNVVPAVYHTVGPVLQVNIHNHILGMGVVNNLKYVVQVLLRRLAQLLCNVPQRPFAEDVHHLASAGRNPVHRQVAVHQAKYLNAVQEALLGRPGAYFGQGLLLAQRHAGGSHLYAVDL